ncbi:hypothetical protein WJ45_13900 [Burkholderia ubonensis]|nr:hypothetical protein WJ45_13900 [Burkholderia ubonensis]KVQ45086.1 hypothetical protein WK04_01740 [Burkholderia ubonensis]
MVLGFRQQNFIHSTASALCIAPGKIQPILTPRIISEQIGQMLGTMREVLARFEFGISDECLELGGTGAKFKRAI